MSVYNPLFDRKKLVAAVAVTSLTEVDPKIWTGA